MATNDNNRRRKFYDQMSETYDLGTFEEFDQKMNNAESRKKLHDFIDKDGKYDIGTFEYFDEAMRPIEQKATPVEQQPVAQTTAQSQQATRETTTQQPVNANITDGYVPQDTATQQQPVNAIAIDGNVVTESQLQAMENGAPVVQKEPAKYGTQEYANEVIEDDVNPDNPYKGMTRQQAINEIGRKFYNEWYGQPGSYGKIEEELAAYNIARPEEYGHIVAAVRNHYTQQVARNRIEQLLSGFKHVNNLTFDDVQAVLDSREAQKAIEEDLQHLGLRNTENMYEDEESKKKAREEYEKEKEAYYQMMEQQLVQVLTDKYGYLPASDSRSSVGRFAGSLMSGGSKAHDDRILTREYEGMIADQYEDTIKDIFDEAYQKAAEKSASVMKDADPTKSSSLGYALMAEYESNKLKDPDTILQAILEKVNSPALLLVENQAMLDRALEDALARNMDINEYLEKYIAPAIQNSIMREFRKEAVKREMPKSDFEYIMRGLSDDSVIGMILNGILMTDSQLQYRDMANAQYGEYNSNIWKEGARLATGMAADFWLWTGWGKIGSMATARLLSMRAGALATAKGITREAAFRLLEEEGKHYLEKGVVDAMMKRIPQSMITMSGAMATSEAVRGFSRGEDFADVFRNTLGAGTGGALSGMAFGATGGLMGRLTSRLSGLQRLAGKLAGLEVEAGTLYTTEELQKMMAGEDAFENPFEGLFEANVKLGFIKASGNPLESVRKLFNAIAHPVKTAKGMMKPDMSVLDEADVKDLQESAEGKDLLEALTSMRSARSTEDGEREGYINEEKALAAAEAYEKYMTDPNRPWARKQKVARLLGGIVPPSGREIKADIEETEDGAILRTRNIDGQCVREIHYDSREEAENAMADLNGEFFRNTTSSLEDQINSTEAYVRFNEYFEEAYRIAAEKMANGEELTKAEQQAVFLHQHQDELMDIYKAVEANEPLSEDGKNLADIYREHFEGYVMSNRAANAFTAAYEREHGLVPGTINKAKEKESLTTEEAKMLLDYQKAMMERLDKMTKLKEAEDAKPAAEDAEATDVTGQKMIEGAVTPPDQSAGPEAPEAPETSEQPVAGGAVRSESRQAAYDRGVAAANNYADLSSIAYDSNLATVRMAMLFPDTDPVMGRLRRDVMQAIEAGDEAEADRLVQSNAGYMTDQQKQALEQYRDAMELIRGVDDGMVQDVKNYEQKTREEIKGLTANDGTIRQLELNDGRTVYLLSGDPFNKYGAVIVTDGNTNEQVSAANIKAIGPVQVAEDIVRQKTEAYSQHVEAQMKAIANGSIFLPGSQVDLSIGGNIFRAKTGMRDQNGNYVFVLEDGSQVPMSPSDAQMAASEATRLKIQQQLADEKKAVAVQQQTDRFSKGIVGFADGAPDLTAKATDPKAAAEYLMKDSEDGNHAPVLKSIESEIERLNADKVRNLETVRTLTNKETIEGLTEEEVTALAEAQQAIDDAEGRRRKWGEIRQELMDDGERTKLELERQKAINKALDVTKRDNQTDNISIGEEVPTAQGLMGRFEEKGDAASHIDKMMADTKAYYRDKLFPNLSKVRETLDDFRRGLVDLSEGELADLTRQLVELEEEESYLINKQNELKNLASSIGRLYAQRENANLTPHERKMRQLEKETNRDKKLKLAKEAYAEDPEAAAVLDNVEPQDVYEWIAANLGEASLNWEGIQRGDHYVRGVSDMVGKDKKRGIGNDSDTKGYNYFLAPTGKGKGYDEVVHAISEGSPYSTEEVSDALYNMLTSASKPTDISHRIVDDRIAKAEEIYETNLEREREAEEEAKREAEDAAIMQMTGMTPDEYDAFISDLEQRLAEQEGYKTSDEYFNQITEQHDRENERITGGGQEDSTPKEQRQETEPTGTEAAGKADNTDADSVKNPIQGLDGYTEKDVTDMVRQHFAKLVGEDGPEIVDVKVIGSRVNGDADENSDLDVLLEYKGNMKEDGLFNILNDEEDRLTIEGIPVDINPITKGQSGTIAQFLERNKDYDKARDKQNISFPARLAKAKAETDTNPTEEQKKAGNYKMGHISFGGYRMSIENPKGSIRSGKDANGKPWSIEMKDSYGYIGKKLGADGDHIDFFINDDENLDDYKGFIFVVDQKNDQGEFDEHKVMYGYGNWISAKRAYERNYEPGWWDKHVMGMTGTTKDDFDKWIADSDRKTKPFADYRRIQIANKISDPTDQLLADVEARKKMAAQQEEKPAEKPAVDTTGTVAEPKEVQPSYKEGELEQRSLEDLKQLKKKRQKDLSTSRYLLKATNVKAGSDKEQLLNNNIAQAEADLDAIDAEIKRKEADRKARIEQQEIGGAMVDRLEDMGLDVTTDFREMRKARKAAEKDNSEEGKLRHFETPDGQIYGFVYRGKMYLDPRKIDANLPVHEYAHPWCEAFRKLNPEGWKNIVDLMKADKETWDFVKKLNPDLKDENDIAEEMIAKCSGEKGRKYAEEEYKRMNAKDPDYKSKWGNIWQNISKAIQDFWKKVGDFLHIKYESAEQVYDQVVRDFANKMNPRKRVEDWLKDRDKAYMEAVKKGDEAKAKAIFDEALRENIGNGITPFVSTGGYRGRLQKLAHDVKTRDPKAIAKVADLMAPIIPKDAVLVPAPSHTGKATDMLDLAQAISERTGAPVADVLTSEERPSQYEAKYAGQPIAAKDMGIVAATEQLPADKLPVVIDNVVDTGNTAEACIQALGKGIVASLADSKGRYKRVATLKSAEPVVTDKKGQTIPLSKRFELPQFMIEELGLFSDADFEEPEDNNLNQYGLDESTELGKRLTELKKEAGPSGLVGYVADDAYVFVGESGKPVEQLNVKGIVKGEQDGMTTVSVPEALFDVVMPKLVKDGYRMALVDNTKIRPLKPKDAVDKMLNEVDRRKQVAREKAEAKADEAEANDIIKNYLKERPEDTEKEKIQKRATKAVLKVMRDAKVPYKLATDGEERDMYKLFSMANQEAIKAFARRPDIRRTQPHGSMGRYIIYNMEDPFAVPMYAEKLSVAKHVLEFVTRGKGSWQILDIGYPDQIVETSQEMRKAAEIQPVTLEDGTVVQFMVEMPEAPVFFSNAMKAVDGIKQEKATPEQWLKMIEKNGGLKAGEDKWIGLSDFLKENKNKTLTKQEVMDFIRQNQIMVEEVHYGDDYHFDDNGNMVWEENPIHDVRLQYTTNGLNNKREIALVVPTIEPYKESDHIHFGDAGGGRAVAWVRFGDTELHDPEIRKSLDSASEELYDYLDRMSEKYKTNPDYPEQMEEKRTAEEKAEHQRIMANIRKYDEADEANTKKVLVIDEIQSKRHQDARELGYQGEFENSPKKQYEVAYDKLMEYKQELDEKYGEYHLLDQLTPEERAKYDEMYQKVVALSEVKDDKVYSVPDAPFEKNWHELAMKRMLRYAAENGYDKIAWTTGEQQAERYDLGGVVESINAYPHSDPMTGEIIPEQYDVFVKDKNGEYIHEQGIEGVLTKEQILQNFGKDLGARIIKEADEHPDGTAEISGDGLLVGAEGMQGFYDQMLPRFMNKYGKKWGVKVEKIELPEIGQTMWTIDVTPEMKESVMQGQPMFQAEKNGILGWSDKNGVTLTKKGLNPNTPIHECSHLWDNWCQKEQPELWKQIVAAMKTTPMWQQIRENPNYRAIWNNDDKMASEVKSRLTGATSEEEFTKAAFKPGATQDIINKVKSALKKFWESLLRLFGKTTKTISNEASSVEAIRRMTLRDLMNQDFEKVMKAVTESDETAAMRGEIIRKTLMGVHNITEDKLRKAIKLGGLANPSMAVIDTEGDYVHSDYGGISLIPKASLIDAKTGRNAGTFTADAWTPSYPPVELVMSSKGWDKFFADKNAIEKNADGGEELASRIRVYIESYLEGRDPDAMYWWYMYDRGLNPKTERRASLYDKKLRDRVVELTDGNERTTVSDLPYFVIEELVSLYHEYKNSKGEELKPVEERILFTKQRINPNDNNKLRQMRLQSIVDDLEKYGEIHSNINDFISSVNSDAKREGEVDVYSTFLNARKTVEKEGRMADFQKWLEELNKRYGIEEKIFDGWTPSGNKKYIANTLENVSKYMKKQGLNGATNWSSIGEWIAKVANKETTLEGIRSQRKNLGTPEAEHNAFHEKWGTLMHDIALKMGEGDSWSGEQRMTDALGHKDIASYVKREYGVELSKEDKETIDAFIKAVRTNFPTGYFETKFERPVKLDEFEIAVVPEDTSADIVEALKNAGLDVRTYNNTGNEEQRKESRRIAVMDAVGMRDDILFHIETDDDEIERLEREPKEIGYRNVAMNEDGTLGSPMANRLGKKGEGRKATSTFEFGKWERSDENPELANEKGKIDLIKPNGKSVEGVDYNPYIHIRPNKVNKQFKEAWRRPELIYVETEYPASELNGEYRAEKAAKSVGKHKWGTQGESLILSRWDKPVRMVPWEEVADDWEKEFKGRGVEFDIIPPKLLPILAERGVEILPPHKGAGKECQAAYEAFRDGENADKMHTEVVAVEKALGGEITPEEVKEALNSKLVAQWQKAMNGAKAPMLFGSIPAIIREMAKATIGYDNKYEVGSMFNNAIEAVNDYLQLAKENGLDADIADKYDFHDGDVVQGLINSDKPMFTKAELAAIEKCLKPKGYEDFLQAVQAVADEKLIRAEEERIKKYDDGEAVTKALALYHIAARRMREQYEKDERFFTPRTYVDGSTDLKYKPDYQPKEGEKVETRYSMKKKVADELLKRIATTPISAQLTSLPGEYDIMRSRGNRPLLAPNGEKSNLDKENYYAVRTPSFKRYFGDWEKGARKIAVVQAKEKHPFNTAQRLVNLKKDVSKFAEEKGIIGTMTNEQTNNKGEIGISKDSIEKMVDDAYNGNSVDKDIHLTAIRYIRDIIRDSIIGETHNDHLKGPDGKRRPENGINPDVMIHRLYGAIDIDGKVYRTKTTVKETLSRGSKKAYTYEVTKIELLSGKTGGEVISTPKPNNSILAAKLLNKVEKSHKNGEKLLDQSVIVDENGEPLVVYKRTADKPSTFDTKYGSFFSNEPIDDKSFGEHVGKYFLNIRKPLVVDAQGETWSYPLWRILADKDGNLPQTQEEYEQVLEKRHLLDIAPKEVWDIVLRDDTEYEFDDLGYIVKQNNLPYDGVIIRNIGESQAGRQKMDDYIALEPTQIKSAEENNGDYDPTNPDIRRSSGGTYSDSEKAMLVDAAEAAGESLGGVEVKSVTYEQADRKTKVEIANGTKGIYNPNTGEVTLLLDNIEDVEDAKRTVYHEKLGHEGLVALLGSQEAVNKFGDFIFKSASKELKMRMLNKADEEGYGLGDRLRYSKAAQEVFGDIAADGPRTADEFSLITKVKHYLIKLLKALGIKIKGLVNDQDLRYYVLKTGEALKRWNKMTPEQQANVKQQADKYDIMRSRGGKPRKRNDESLAQYMQRLREWEKWKIAEEKAAAANDPMPDKEAIDKKWSEKFDADLKEWRDSHGISEDEGNGPGTFPKREDGESPQEYGIRVADYEAKADMWKDAPSYFDYIEKAQQEYKQEYTDWKMRYDLQEAENVDMNVYEGNGGYGPVSDEDIEAETRMERDLAEAVGVEIDSEGAKRHAKLAVIERRKNLESSNAEDAIWLHDFVKMTEQAAKDMSERTGNKITGKMLREALPFIIEETYWEEILRDEDGNVVAINDLRDKLPIKEGPELDALLSHIKDWYDEFYQILEEAGLRNDAGYIEDGYVNHVWDREKSDPKAWEKYVENYQRTKSPNMRHREIETYQEGIDVGLVPKYTDIADMIAHYSRQNNEAVANKYFLQDLSGYVVEELNADGEVVSVLPLLNSEKPDALTRDRYTEYYVPGVGDVYVLNDVKKRFASIFGTMRTQDVADWLRDVAKAYDLAGSTMKKIQLSLSGFHMGALTEVAMAQMRPDRAMRALFSYIIVDSIKNGTIPAYAHPEDFKFAASHLVQLGATQDYAASDVNNITGKLREIMHNLYESDSAIKKAAGAAGSVPAIMLDWVNIGMDKVLWNYLHDGLKIACFKMFAEQIQNRVMKEGLSDEMREKLLDEAGQYVNDTFGGQYFELLNITPATMKWMRRALLSPDWLISTQRHFFANFGFGSLYSDSSFKNYLKYNADNIKRAFGVNVPHDELRRFRSKNAKLCYVLGVCFFFYTMMNALNAFFRYQDEQDQKDKAEEERKTNPNYRSPYELAYPDGMKWYDYTMLGNGIGQQTHLYAGRYEDGSETYVRWGKQFREFPEMFIGRHGVEFPTPLIERIQGKANPMVSLVRDNLGALGVWGFTNNSDIKEIQAKYGKTIGVLAMNARHLLPFSVPTQAEKEFKAIDLVMPSQKGFTRYKTVDYFKTYIQAGDMDGIVKTYNAAVMNNIDAEACLKAAISTVKATQRKELADGVSDLTTAAERFDKAEGLSERNTMRKKMRQYLAGNEYKAFSRNDAIEAVNSFLDGEDMEKLTIANQNYLMLQTSADVIADWRVDSLNKKANEYDAKIKEAKEAGNTERAEALAIKYASWLKIKKWTNQYKYQLSRNYKKKLGESAEKDQETMNLIREKRDSMMSRINNLEPPK